MRNRIVTAVKQRFSIRKLSIGAASVLLGTSLYFMGVSAPVVHAATNGETPASSETSTDSKDPVSVAGQSKYSDVDVNNAIDQYAKKNQDAVNEQEEKEKTGNKVIIRPSDKQPVKVNSIDDRVTQVKNIQNDIQKKIDQANQGWDAINTCKKSNNYDIVDGKDSSYFENQSLSVDDEKDSEINQITVTDGSKTKNVNTKLVDGKSKNIDGLVDGQSKNIDGYGINITHTSYITDKEKYTMKVNSNNKVIVDFQDDHFQDDQWKGKEITVTYDNLNNSYYLENKTKRIKISRIDRTFSSIIRADNYKLFNPKDKVKYKNDAIYDECNGPQLIIYNDPSDGFFYNNIKQISVKDTYYYDDNEGKKIPINFDTKDPAWVFVTSLNSNPSGNIEKVRALRPDNSPVPVLVPVNAEKIAGSTVTDHNDGWCYSNINNNFSNNANNIFGQKLDWDNNDEYNRFGFVGTVAFQYHPGMTLQYRADDWQWGSHWACTQTQLPSSLNEIVIICDHIKDSTHAISDKKAITETITYKMSDGSNAPDKVEKHVEFNRDGYNDEVTKQDHWNKWQPGETQTFDVVPTPEVKGYTPDTKSVEAKTVTPGDKDITETVTYNPDQQKAKVLFIDDTAKNTLDTHNLTGVTNGHESYSPSEEINQFVNKHYVLVSSDYPDNGFTYDKDNSKDQVFEVHFVHTYEPVETSQTITETVHYIDANGKPVAPDHVAKVVIKVTGTRDKVTDSIIWNTPSTGHFDKVISPEVPNMTPDKKLIPGRDVQYGDSDITESVVYTPDNTIPKASEKPDKPSKEVSKTLEKPNKSSKEVSKIPEKPNKSSSDITESVVYTPDNTIPKASEKPDKPSKEVPEKPNKSSKEVSKAPEKSIDSRTVDNHVSAKSTAKRELPQTGATTNTGIWTGLVSMIASLGLLGASKKRKKN